MGNSFGDEIQTSECCKIRSYLFSVAPLVFLKRKDSLEAFLVIRRTEVAPRGRNNKGAMEVLGRLKHP